MNSLVKTLTDKKGFLPKQAVSADAIEEAERALGLTFAEEYKEYLSKFGEVKYYGHELTGILSAKRLHVVDVTLEERELNPTVPSDLYVVEQAGIDGIVVWQSCNGDVYSTVPNGQPKKIAKSLNDYVIGENE